MATAVSPEMKVRNHLALLNKALDAADIGLRNYDSKSVFIALRDAAFYRGVIVSNIPRLPVDKQSVRVYELQELTNKMRALGTAFVGSNLRFV
jgi:hypothetical protein